VLETERERRQIGTRERWKAGDWSSGYGRPKTGARERWTTDERGERVLETEREMEGWRLELGIWTAVLGARERWMVGERGERERESAED
jgi:hypothetical protein